MILRTLRAAKSAFYENVYSMRATVPQDRPTISFTFDDVPVSALTNGAAMLDQHGVSGTFYVAATFCNDARRDGEKREHLSIEDCQALQGRGHQIGCHTYSHRPMTSVSATEGCLDAQKNRVFFQQGLGAVLEDFSFPLGAVTVGTKRDLRSRYKSLRGIKRGINRGVTDLACLRSVNLYSAGFPKEELKSLVDDCCANGGWLIFYTHGVHASPGRFDTSPEDFRWIVEYCTKTSARMLSVEQARRHLFS